MWLEKKQAAEKLQKILNQNDPELAMTVDELLQLVSLRIQPRARAVMMMTMKTG